MLGQIDDDRWHFTGRGHRRTGVGSVGCGRTIRVRPHRDGPAVVQRREVSRDRGRDHRRPTPVEVGCCDRICPGYDGLRTLPGGFDGVVLGQCQPRRAGQRHDRAFIRRRAAGERWTDLHRYRWLECLILCRPAGPARRVLGLRQRAAWIWQRPGGTDDLSRDGGLPVGSLVRVPRHFA